MTSENQWQVKKTGWENFNYRKKTVKMKIKLKKCLTRKP